MPFEGAIESQAHQVMKSDVSFSATPQANLRQGRCSVRRPTGVSQFCSLKGGLLFFGVKDGVLQRGYQEGHLVDKTRFLREAFREGVEDRHQFGWDREGEG